MEACEKLSSISDGLKALQVGRAGSVSRVKTWCINEILQSLISRSNHNRENRKNLLTAKISRPTVLHSTCILGEIQHIYYVQKREKLSHSSMGVWMHEK